MIEEVRATHSARLTTLVPAETDGIEMATTLIQEVGPNYWCLGALPLGVALDLAIGDPRGWPHPVRAVGRMISRAERGLRVAVARQGGGPDVEFFAGVVLVTVVVGLTGSLAWLLTDLCDQLGGPSSLLGRALLIYWGLAIRSLGDEALRASEAAELSTSRRELAMIVGRDTGSLDEAEIRRACVETIGENANDAVVAPLFWLAVAGPAGLWAYKAINTLDSMVGYRNAKYLQFGRAAARLDDLANLIPARLTWLLIALSAALLGEEGGSAFRIGWRDGRKHPSPNAAWGEAAMAGALGIQLGGPATYAGIAGQKPLLGDPILPIDRSTVRRAVRIMRVAALHAAALSWAARIAIVGG
jgi:adenosylcobinamide-phosphate synthase